MNRYKSMFDVGSMFDDGHVYLNGCDLETNKQIMNIGIITPP
jgi:hypothetical protein